LEINILYITFLADRIPSLKTWLMFSPKESFRTHTLINRLLVIASMILAGFSIAKSIQASRLPGLILAIVSLGAGIYFIYLLQQLNANREQEETS